MKKTLIILFSAILFACVSKHGKEDFIGNWKNEKNPNHQVDIEPADANKYKVSEFMKGDASFNMTSNPNY